MQYYRIKDAPKYAISSDGETVINIKTKKQLNHNIAPYAPDYVKRFGLYVDTTDMFGKNKSVIKTFRLDYLKQFIKKENLIEL